MLPVVSFILRNIASLCFAVQFWRKNGTIMQQCPVANSRLIDFASCEVGKFADSRLSVANFATFGTTLVAPLPPNLEKEKMYNKNIVQMTL